MNKNHVLGGIALAGPMLFAATDVVRAEGFYACGSIGVPRRDVM